MTLGPSKSESDSHGTRGFCREDMSPNLRAILTELENSAERTCPEESRAIWCQGAFPASSGQSDHSMTNHGHLNLTSSIKPARPMSRAKGSPRAANLAANLAAPRPAMAPQSDPLDQNLLAPYITTSRATRSPQAATLRQSCHPSASPRPAMGTSISRLRSELADAKGIQRSQWCHLAPQSDIFDQNLLAP
eukprot:CAMPEP_0206268478 /NCGR_PEP_ID=MMETSP0047_2-20121206/31733_1 /ASSEMBLY_ACC=CAM_ASM_000192 /TAXON_ID=195065 /ORGANISM="Chroomonas mesostigmatica_cf, Strain CCMP1168" /LENGTH=190 /DNA_ID=CAMNT_0053696809 /DNA_START=309 /DNA_END=882 /DNA_ORIENTATION=-